MLENFACDTTLPLAQNPFKLVDFCPARFSGFGNCAAHGKLAKLEGSYEEPG
jgi:hypothetical protein